MIKKIYKFIKTTIIVILCLILLGIAIELFLGGKRLYDYNHTYSLDEKITYLSDPWYFSYGFPQKNITVLRNNNVKVEYIDEGFLKAKQSTMFLSTKHFDFRISDGGYWNAYDKKIKKTIIFIDGSSYYCDKSYNLTNRVDKKTVKLMKKELNNKMNEIGHKLNYQIYNPF
ncbi:hypothetical protein ACWCL1_06060 [Ligilactobacillus sp. LYQ135]